VKQVKARIAALPDGLLCGAAVADDGTAGCIGGVLWCSSSWEGVARRHSAPAVSSIYRLAVKP